MTPEYESARIVLDGILNSLAAENEQLQRRLEQAKDWDKTVSEFITTLTLRYWPQEENSRGHAIDRLMHLENCLKRDRNEPKSK